MKQMLKGKVNGLVQLGAFQTRYQQSVAGALTSKLRQVECGDLSFVVHGATTASLYGDDDNEDVTNGGLSHIENGFAVKVVSTSQVEGENARINALVRRRVKLQVLVRILMVHSIQVDIRQGVKFGRIPENVSHCNIIDLLRTTLHCHGVLASTAGESWVYGLILDMMKSKSCQKLGVVQSDKGLIQKPNELFGWDTSSTPKPTHQLPSRPVSTAQFLCSANVASTRVSSLDFASSMAISSSNLVFNKQERELLQLVRLQQQRFSQHKWSSCAVVTTLLHNRGVLAFRDCAPKPHSHVVAEIDSFSQNGRVVVGASLLQYNAFENALERPLRDDTIELAGAKHDVAAKLFDALSLLHMHQLYEVKKLGHRMLFARVWHCLCFISFDIRNISEQKLEKVWINIRKTKYHTKQKIAPDAPSILQHASPATSQPIEHVHPAEGQTTASVTIVDCTEAPAATDTIETGTRKTGKLPGFKKFHFDFINAEYASLVGCCSTSKWLSVRQSLARYFGDKFPLINERTLAKRVERFNKNTRKRLPGDLEGAAK